MTAPLLPRRQFLKTALAAAGGFAAAPWLARAQEVLSERPLKIGVVGCGGRGLGAAANALRADGRSFVSALADVFPERIEVARRLLGSQFPGRAQVDDEHCCAGLDGYKKLLSTDVDVVILATPPCFRPDMAAAAVRARKHLYVEKPVAVDVPGVLSILQTAELARERRLVILDGYCWRYDAANVEAHRLLDAGAIGKPLHFDAKYYAAPPKSPLARDSRPANESDVAWALRNWTAWNWLSGGPFVEQACHAVDGMIWSFGERLPVAAKGCGGRAQRRDDGDVWDHYDVYFEYEDGSEHHISSRQWTGSHGEIADCTIGERGTLHTPYRPRILGENRWRYRGEPNNMYEATHVEFFRCIRAGEWKQTLAQAAEKTLVAILGREAAHTGKRLMLDDLRRSTVQLMPDRLTMETRLSPARIPFPGT